MIATVAKASNRGSKPGERRGGRAKGAPNNKTAAKIAAIEASGLTPLDFMLQVLRDDNNELPIRMDAAKNAAPYVHPKRSPIDGEGNDAGLVVNVYTGVPRGGAGD